MKKRGNKSIIKLLTPMCCIVERLCLAAAQQHAGAKEEASAKSLSLLSSNTNNILTQIAVLVRLLIPAQCGVMNSSASAQLRQRHAAMAGSAERASKAVITGSCALTASRQQVKPCKMLGPCPY